MGKKVERIIKNKNSDGFSLIEILAVIAIIAIIFMIATYSVSSILKTSKESTLNQTFIELKETASTMSKELDDSNWSSIDTDKLTKLGINSDSNDDFLMTCISVQDMINQGYYKDNEFDNISEVNKDTYVIVIKNNSNKAIVTEEIDKEEYCSSFNPQNKVDAITDIKIEFKNECTNKDKAVTITYPNQSNLNNMFMIDGSDASFEDGNIYECSKKDANTCSNTATNIESGKWYKVDENEVKIKVENNSTINAYSYNDTNSKNKTASIDTIDKNELNQINLKTSDGISSGYWHDNIYSLNAYGAENPEDKTKCAAVTYTYQIAKGVDAKDSNFGEVKNFNEKGISSFSNGIASLQVGDSNYGIFQYKIIAKNKAGNTKFVTYDSRLSKYIINLDNKSATSAGTEKLYARYSEGIYLDDKYSNKLDTITIPQKTGYNFDGYYTEENGKGTKKIDNNGNAVNFSSEDYKKEVTLYANWKLKDYTITVNSGTGGTVKVEDTTKNTSATASSGGSTTLEVTHGDTIKVTATASTGYNLSTLKHGSTSMNSGSTFTVSAAETVAATWTLKKYTLTINSGTGGTVKVEDTTKNTSATASSGGSTTLEVTHGDTIKVTATASTGYNLSTLKHGSTSMNSGSTFTVSAAETVAATWSQLPYISFSLGQNNDNSKATANKINEWNSFEIYNDINIACSKDSGKVVCKEVSTCTGVDSCLATDGTQALGWLSPSDRPTLSWNFSNFVSSNSGIDMLYNTEYDYSSFNSLNKQLSAATGNEYNGKNEINSGGLRWFQFVVTKDGQTIKINIYLALMWPPTIHIGKYNSTSGQVEYSSAISDNYNVACNAGHCNIILKDKFTNISGNSEFSSSCKSINNCKNDKNTQILGINASHKIYYEVNNGSITEIAYNEWDNYSIFSTSFPGTIQSPSSPLEIKSGGYRLLRFTATGTGGTTVGYVYLAVGDCSDFGSCSTSTSSAIATKSVSSYYTLSGSQVTSTWLSLDDNTYYLDEIGGTVSNTTTSVGDSSYTFDNDGKKVDGWYTKDGYYYYMSNGENLKGTITSDGDTAYYINDNDSTENKWISFNTEGRQMYAYLNKDISVVYLEPNSLNTEEHKISAGTKLIITQTNGTGVSKYGSNYKRLGLMTDDGYEFYYDISKSTDTISCMLKNTNGDEIIDCP